MDLQKVNTRFKLSPSEIQSEGFVTVVHNLETLRQMNIACPHIIASVNEQVIGYALAMVPSFREDIPVLKPLFGQIDKLMVNRNYLVMGQICIDKPYRGKGVFRGMYEFYSDQLKHQYDCLVTEVAQENPRSLEAHKSIGFETIHTRNEHGKYWEILSWEWRVVKN